jgi:hypothetical protein
VGGHLYPVGKNIVQAGLMREVMPLGFALAGYKFSSAGNYIFPVKVTLFLCHCSVVLASCRVIDGGIKKYSALFMREAIMYGVAIIRAGSQFRNQRIGSVLWRSKLI